MGSALARPVPFMATLLLIAACEPPTYPGESLGSYEVRGTLMENTCGTEAVSARNPLTFPVELRDDEGVALWRRHRAPLMSGIIDEDGQYVFVFQNQVPILAPDPALGFPGCALGQLEEITVALAEQVPGEDAGVSDAPFGSTDAGVTSIMTGVNTITLTPLLGGDCTPALAVGGGPFLTLPCRVHYELTGTPRQPF